MMPLNFVSSSTLNFCRDPWHLQQESGSDKARRQNSPTIPRIEICILSEQTATAEMLSTSDLRETDGISQIWVLTEAWHILPKSQNPEVRNFSTNTDPSKSIHREGTNMAARKYKCSLCCLLPAQSRHTIQLKCIIAQITIKRPVLGEILNVTQSNKVAVFLCEITVSCSFGKCRNYQWRKKEELFSFVSVIAVYVLDWFTRKYSQ